MSEWIGYLISAACSGGLAWIFTIKWTRKQEEAKAMSSVQDVYQELITDLKNDREELRSENEKLKQQLDSLNERLNQLEKQCEENARRVNAMKPFVCYVHGCPNRMTNKD